MDNQSFNNILDDQINLCKTILVDKAKEYATEDRLHNFKVVAALRGCTLRDAVGGLMSKHTVSIFDMCRSPETFKEAIWDEKITDHINYLILLKAVLIEESCSINDQQNQTISFGIDNTTSTSTITS